VVAVESHIDVVSHHRPAAPLPPELLDVSNLKSPLARAALHEVDNIFVGTPLLTVYYQ
jgi:hypothetical protein